MSSLRVLAVAADEETLRTIERTVISNGDTLLTAMDVAEAIATASSERPDVAFVDVRLEERAGLALVHHLPAVCQPITVYAIAPASDAELGAEAIALGAAGLLVSPPSGDALLRAVGEVRTRRAEDDERRRLLAELELARHHEALVDRLARLLHQSGKLDVADAARTIAQTLAEATGAGGVALYALKGAAQHEWVELAAVGTVAAREDDAAAGSARRIVPLSAGDDVLGHVVIDTPRGEPDLGALATLAAAVLAKSFAGAPTPMGMRAQPVASGNDRVYTLAHFEDATAREIDKAKRHSRRLAVAVILLDEKGEERATAVEDVVLGAVRESDVLARAKPGELLLLLPETGALGAHACRRRVLVRAEGDRRAKPAASDRRGPVQSRPSRGLPLSIGVATYPHDGKALPRLLERARQRAEDAQLSAVHTLGLASQPLGEIIDTLLGCPMLDAGRCSPFPLDLAMPAALSLVASACREARRGGGATILTSANTGMGWSSAVRAATATASDAVSLHEVDLGAVEGCKDAEAVAIVAEHGTWSLCGRREGARFRGVHCADPLLADLVAQRLARAGGVRLP